MVDRKLLSKLFCLAAGTVALFYVVYKAATNSFTHDEAYTYTHWVFRSFINIILYIGADTNPNNHVLNTVLMKISECFFGSSEFSLRLPNVLACAGYLIIAYRWLNRFDRPWLTMAGFVILAANPYMLDFFTLARGYGLSMFFLLASLAAFTHYISSGNSRSPMWAFIHAALAVWSNFTLLIYFGALWIVFVLYQILLLRKTPGSFSENTKVIYREIRKPLNLSLVLALVIARPLIVMAGDLFGPADGFWTNTVRSLIYYSTNTHWAESVDAISVFVALVTMASAALFLFDLHRQQYDIGRSPHILFLLLPVVTAGLTMLQHVLFKVPFLEGRTALLFIVLFGFELICLLQYMMTRWHAIAPAILSIPFALFLLYNFTAHAHLDYNITWQYDSHTKQMLQFIEKDRNENAPERMRLGITWIFEPTINYYRQAYRLDWLERVSREGYQGDYDYYYVEKDSAYLAQSNKVILKRYDDIQTLLAKTPR